MWGNFNLSIIMNMKVWYGVENMKPFLSKVIQTRLAAIYSSILCIGIFFYGNFYILLRYLQHLEVIYPTIFMNLFAAIFSFGSQYICVFILDLGFISVPWCHTASYIFLFVQIVVYIFVTKLHRDTWDGFKREALYNWGEFFYTSIGGAIQMAAESFCFQVAVILAGTMGPTYLGAQNVLYNIDSIIYMVPYSFSTAVSIRAGQALGKRDSGGAKFSFVTSLIVSASITPFFGIPLIVFRDSIPLIFTSYPDINEEVAKSLPYVAAIVFADGMRTSFDGAIRGCGRQAVGAIILLLSYYLVGLSSGLSLMVLTDLKLSGFWIGIVAGAYTSLILSVTFFSCLNWEKEGERAQKRVMLKQERSITSEVTRLLSGRTHRSKGSSFCNDNLEPQKDYVMSDKEFHKLIIRRGLLLIGCLSVILTSLMLKYFVFQDIIDGWSITNQTYPSNMTNDYFL